MYKFPIIVFEGIEGSGKTFHIKYVQKYLKKKILNLLNFVNLEDLKIQKKLEI